MTSPILIADDGELEDVRDQLRELGVEWIEARDRSAEGLPESVSLLVTNTRQALEPGNAASPAALHLVVYDAGSPDLRRVLEGSGCDLMLERPLNLHTLDLIANQALYAGPERRRGPRVVVSATVPLSHGDREAEATLTQLSLRGCGLLTSEDIPVGREIAIVLPAELTGDEPLKASGPALAVRPSDADPERRHVSVAFRLMRGDSRRVVAQVMERFGRGAELRPREAPPAPAQPVDGDERRVAPRKVFMRRVLAAGAGISHVLFGRDLAPGGMRVRPDPQLQLGDELKLAIHSRPGQPAIMVKAVVMRDDGDDGMVLQFKDLPESIASRLGQIISALPTVPEGKRSSAPGPDCIVTEILEHSEGR